MFNINVRNLDGDVQLDKIVTDFNPLNNDSEFNSAGVYSVPIFGHMGNHHDFSCDCGEVVGNFNKDTVCTTCNTPVTFKGLSIQREGWVDLGEYCIHPLMYRYLTRIIGKTKLDGILTYLPDVTIGGIETPPEAKFPFTGIGMEGLRANLVDIVEEYTKRRVSSTSDVALKHQYEMRLKFILENKEKVFIKYFPVINCKLRPALLVGEKFSFDIVNTFYNNLIRGSALMKSLTSGEATVSAIENITKRNQETINQIYVYIIETISGKEGAIRETLLGNRLNFTSRMVIVPLDGNAKIDDIDIPYRTALELLKPQVILRLRKLRKISNLECLSIWEEATRIFSKTIYSIMMDLIKSPNVGLIINRNPTIALGSILLLRIRNIKKDLEDSTAGISNLILTLLGADYDGDVLNFILIYGKEFNELFSKFNPRNFLVDPATGRFNRAFLPTKDTLLGLTTLVNDH